MTSTNPTPEKSEGDSRLAISIMFFAIAWLFFMLGWADGVRHDRTYLHIPQNGGWLVATVVMLAIGIAFLVWSRSARPRS